MRVRDSRIKLSLLGPFRLEGPDGVRIEIRSKRGQALIAMLATSGGGERTRGWLQEWLWCSRSPDQANASLRRELSNLRKVVNTEKMEFIQADNGRVWLDLSLAEIDVRQGELTSKDEFLEAIDIAGEELFEDWLREERASIDERRNNRPHIEPQSAAAEKPEHVPAAQISGRPVIAVLPFSGPDDGLNTREVARGISEDLINGLSQLRWLPVVARSLSFTIDAAQMDAKSAGKMLNAQYIVEGKIRPSGQSQILTVMLSDAVTGQSIWSNKMPLAPQDGSADIEMQIMEITSVLGMQIDVREQASAQQKPLGNLSVNELIWRARWHLNRLAPDDIKQAVIFIEQALEKEPRSSDALVQYAWIKIWGLWLERGTEQDIRDARKMAQKAIIADYDDARGHMLAGIAEMWLKQPLRAEALLLRAIELNPSLAMAHAQLGSALYLKGEVHDAISALHRAAQLNPNGHDLFFTYGELGMAYLLASDWEKALEFADRALARRTSYWVAHITKIRALMELGQGEEAERARLEFDQLQPDFRSEYINWLPFLNASKHKFLKDELNLFAEKNDP